MAENDQENVTKVCRVNVKEIDNCLMIYVKIPHQTLAHIPSAQKIKMLIKHIEEQSLGISMLDEELKTLKPATTNTVRF